MFAVVITEKGGAQRRQDFDKNEVTIGRVQGNDIILPKGNVSKRHSRIVIKDSRFIVVDLKSTNGTYVNGRKITSPLVVKAGDKIYIGDFILTLEEDPARAGAAAPGAVQPGAVQPGAVQPGAVQPGSAQAGAEAAAPAPAGPPPVAAVAARTSAPPPIPPRSSPAAPAAPPPSAVPAAPQPAAAPPAAVAPPAAAPPAAAPPAAAPPAAAPPAAAPPAAAFSAPASAPPPAAAPAQASVTQPPAAPSPSAVPTPAVPAPAGPAAASAPAASAATASAPPPAAAPAPGAPASPPLAMPQATIRPTARPASNGAAPAAPQAPAAPASFAKAGVGDRYALMAVLSRVAESFPIHDVLPPVTETAPRYRSALQAVQAAVAELSATGRQFDAGLVTRAALDEAVGLGPLSAWVDDPSACFVLAQGAETVMVDHGEGVRQVEGFFSSSTALSVVVGRLVTMAGGGLEPSRFLYEGTLPNGVFFTAALPPVAVGGPIVELHRTPRKALSGEEVVAQGLLSEAMFEVLRRAREAQRNVAVLGSNEGVTHLCSALANLANEGERTVVIEASPTLQLGGEHVARLAAVQGQRMADIIRQAGKMTADQLVIDGVRGVETLDALDALSARGRGCVLGIRTAVGEDAVAHVTALAGLSGHAAGAARTLLPSAVQVLVQVERGDDDKPRVAAMIELKADGPAQTLFDKDFEAVTEPSF